MSLVQGLLHGILHLLYERQGGTLELVMLSFLVGSSSVATVKHYLYETFIFAHRALAIALAITLWIHLSGRSTFERTLVLTAFITSLGANALHWLRQVWWNLRRRDLSMPRITSARYDANEDVVLDISLPKDRIVHPGQYVYLTLLDPRRLSLLQRHPFVIPWWDSRDDILTARSLSIFIHPQNGWTRSLSQQALSISIRSKEGETEEGGDRRPRALQDVAALTPSKPRIWLDGPFGKEYKLEGFDTIILFASGTGIFSLLPFIKVLTHQVMRPKLCLVWKTGQNYAFVNDCLQPILSEDLVSQESPTAMHMAWYLTPELYKNLEREKSPLAGGRRVKISMEVLEIDDHLPSRENEHHRNIGIFGKLQPFRESALLTGPSVWRPKVTA
ncbi:uncharacterized protein LTR77_011150 [Saxophila tyrrhenica]|uniref:FAD-binding 8 domain-containing protein n=1 Tax=Saxophila tyrrhenica TaxID=1690608 RepID=A0AAV9NV14_9PEZI|nr:hypothetical protein LTR77_011150 [Saxophila tyrrhenica]